MRSNITPSLIFWNLIPIFIQAIIACFSLDMLLYINIFISILCLFGLLGATIINDSRTEYDGIDLNKYLFLWISFTGILVLLAVSILFILSFPFYFLKEKFEGFNDWFDNLFKKTKNE